MRCIPFGICLFLFFLCASLFGEVADPQLLNRLKTEGYKELRSREKSYENIHIRWVRKHEEGVLENDYYSQNANVLLRTEIAPEYLEPEKPHWLYRFANNGSYYFSIAKQVADNTWEIYEVKRSSELVVYDSDASDICEILPVYLFTNSIADLLKTPGFEITAVSVLEEQPEETISVDFEITADGVGENIEDLRTGNIHFLPSRGWVTKEITANFNRLGKEFTTKFEYTYGENQNRDYSLERVCIKLIRDYDDPSKDVVWDNEIRQVDNATLPEEEFYMSFYGLPEPEFDLDRITLLQYLFVISGTLLIVIASWQILKKMRLKKDFKE